LLALGADGVELAVQEGALAVAGIAEGDPGDETAGTRTDAARMA